MQISIVGTNLTLQMHSNPMYRKIDRIERHAEHITKVEITLLSKSNGGKQRVTFM